MREPQAARRSYVARFQNRLATFATNSLRTLAWQSAIRNLLSERALHPLRWLTRERDRRDGSAFGSQCAYSSDQLYPSSLGIPISDTGTSGCQWFMVFSGLRMS